MNITDTSTPPPSRKQVVTEPTATSTDSQQPGNRTWEMKTFWIVASTLAFGTIVVPVVGGAVIRRVAWFALRNKAWGKPIVAIITLA